MKGYIKLHREISDHWLWDEKPFSKGQAWIDILLMANHDTKKFTLGNELIEVERGSCITSELKLMDRWGWSKTKVRDFLELLQKDKMLVKKSDKKKTALTVCNYCVWQDSETTEKPQKNHRKTTERPHKNTNKNEEECKEVKKDIYISCQHLSMTEEEYKKLVEAYGEETVKDKLEYAENYAKLKNYKSLYLTLSNWLKADKKKEGTNGTDKQPNGQDKPHFKLDKSFYATSNS